MHCSDMETIIHGYMDRELDPARDLEIEAHLRTCVVCREMYESLQDLHRSLGTPDLYFDAPPQLVKRVREEIRGSAKAQNKRRFDWLWTRWMPLALAASVAAILLALVFLPKPNAVPATALNEELVAAHIRSLMANHLVDVPSSDQHTVKPWFNGRLDFSPPVVDLAARGFPLIGGRLDYIDRRAVAALVYQRRKHYINLFIRPAAGSRLPDLPTTGIRGYNVIAWSNAQMNFAAVSDLNSLELTEFAHLLQDSTGQP